MYSIFFLVGVAALASALPGAKTDLLNLPNELISKILTHLPDERDIWHFDASHNNTVSRQYGKEIKSITKNCYISTHMLLRNDINFIFGYYEVLVWNHVCIDSLYQLFTTNPTAKEVFQLPKIQVVLNLGNIMFQAEVLKMLTQLKILQSLETFKKVTLSLELTEDPTDDEISINEEVLLRMNQLDMRLDRVLDHSGFLVQAVMDYDIVNEYSILNCTLSAISRFPITLNSAICLDFDFRTKNLPKSISLPIYTTVPVLMKTLDRIPDMTVVFDMKFVTSPLSEHLVQWKKRVLPRINHLEMHYLDMEMMNVSNLNSFQVISFLGVVRSTPKFKQNPPFKVNHNNHE